MLTYVISFFSWTRYIIAAFCILWFVRVWICMCTCPFRCACTPLCFVFQKIKNLVKSKSDAGLN